MHSPFLKPVGLDKVYKELDVPDVMRECPTYGMRMLANSLATPYVTVHLLDTMGLMGVPCLCFLGSQ